MRRTLSGTWIVRPGESAVELDQAVYPGAPHGYSMDDTPMYEETAAEKRFDELRAHLGRHL